LKNFCAGGALTITTRARSLVLSMVFINVCNVEELMNRPTNNMTKEQTEKLAEQLAQIAAGNISIDNLRDVYRTITEVIPSEYLCAYLKSLNDMVDEDLACRHSPPFFVMGMLVAAAHVKFSEVNQLTELFKKGEEDVQGN